MHCLNYPDPDILNSIDKLMQKYEAIRGHIRSICGMLDSSRERGKGNVQKIEHNHLAKTEEKHK